MLSDPQHIEDYDSALHPEHAEVLALPGQGLLEGHHVLLGRGPRGSDTREVTPVRQGLPDAVTHLIRQALMTGLIEGHEGQVGRRCLLYTSPSPRDYAASRMPSSA